MKLTRNERSYILKFTDREKLEFIKEKLELLGAEKIHNGSQFGQDFTLYMFTSEKLITLKEIRAVPIINAMIQERLNNHQAQLDAVWKIIEEEVEIIKKQSHDHWWNRTKKRVIRHQQINPRRKSSTPKRNRT